MPGNARPPNPREAGQLPLPTEVESQERFFRSTPLARLPVRSTKGCTPSIHPRLRPASRPLRLLSAFSWCSSSAYLSRWCYKSVKLDAITVTGGVEACFPYLFNRKLSRGSTKPPGGPRADSSQFGVRARSRHSVAGSWTSLTP